MLPAVLPVDVIQGKAGPGGRQCPCRGYNSRCLLVSPREERDRVIATVRLCNTLLFIRRDIPVGLESLRTSALLLLESPITGILGSFDAELLASYKD